MLGAAATLWLTFGTWISAEHLALPRVVARTAAAIAVVELLALLASSYGCEDVSCTAFGEVAGTAARVDVPVFTLVFAAAAAVRARRVGRRP